MSKKKSKPAVSGKFKREIATFLASVQSVFTEDYTTRVHQRRLEKLTQHMQWVTDNDPDSFDLCTWFVAVDAATFADERSQLERAKREWPKRLAAGKKLDCGTTACLVGHLPLVFPKTFKWDVENETVYRRGYRSFQCDDRDLEWYFEVDRYVWKQVIYANSVFWGKSLGSRQPQAAHVCEFLRQLLELAEQRPQTASAK